MSIIAKHASRYDFSGKRAIQKPIRVYFQFAPNIAERVVVRHHQITAHLTTDNCFFIGGLVRAGAQCFHAHRLPFVLGTTPPRRGSNCVAASSARANALKIASA